MTSLTKQEIEEYRQLRGIWRKDSRLYCKQRLGLNATHQQAQLLDSITPSGSKVTARAGHGVGKSGSTSGVIFWHLECFDYSRTIATAPSASQLYSVLWAEAAKWMRRADEKAAADGLPRELWLSSLLGMTQDRIYDKGSPDEWFAVARTSRKEKPDALQGFHASDIDISESGEAVHRSDGGSLLFVVEEASGVPDEIFEVAEGALSSHGARLLMIGNPVRNTGFFARSHREERSSYSAALHFKSSESPLVASDYRDKLVKKYGEGSNVVRVRADGEFPKQDDDVLIPMEAAEAAITREYQPQVALRILGVDVARFGDDRTVFLLRCGSNVEHITVRAKQDTMVTAGMAWSLAIELGADQIHVDVGGVGGGVYDRLVEIRRESDAAHKPKLVGVDSATSAPKRDKRRTETGNPFDAQPYRMRDYIWLQGADWVINDQPSFLMADDDHAQDLAGELSTVRFGFDSSFRLIIESKDKMKKRGLRSPDLADALMLTFAPAAKNALAFGAY